MVDGQSLSDATWGSDCSFGTRCYVSIGADNFAPNIVWTALNKEDSILIMAETSFFACGGPGTTTTVVGGVVADLRNVVRLACPGTPVEGEIVVTLPPP